MTGGFDITRRQLMQTSLAFAGLTMAAPLALALAADENKWSLTETTPGTVLGPFYPLVNQQMDPGSDLTVIKGAAGRAQGQLIYLMGQVLDIKGKPIKDVKVEIWQTNAAGRYNHPSDPNPAPLDPNFVGYGVSVTDSEGRYRFKTIKPGAYPVTQGWDRPPHVHYQLTGRVDRHVTQMWFAGDPLNAQDRLLARLSPAAQAMLTGKIEAPRGDMEPNAKIAVFNVVLTNG